MADYYDEQQAPNTQDAAERVLGFRAAFAVKALGSPSATEPHVMQGYRPVGGAKGYALALASARDLAYFQHQPPVKFADESITGWAGSVDFRALPGIEQDVQQMNQGAYVAGQFANRSPLISSQNYVTQRQIQSAQQNLNGDNLLSAGDTEMLGILYSF